MRATLLPGEISVERVNEKHTSLYISLESPYIPTPPTDHQSYRTDTVYSSLIITPLFRHPSPFSSHLRLAFLALPRCVCF